MAKLIDVNGLRAVVAKINGDTKALKALIDAKANATHEHVAADVKFDDGKNLVEKLAEIQTGGQVDLSGYATEAYVQQQLKALIGGAPEALDTLKELAAALGDNADFASTMTQELAKKVDKAEGQRLITDEEAAKLAGLENYDDSALAGRVATLEAIDHEAFLKAEDIAGKADAADLQALAAEVGDPAVEAAEGVEAKDATGLYKYVDDKVAAAAVEVATEDELLAMYDEIIAEEPQA